MVRTTIKEGSTSLHYLEFYDAEGEEVDPETLKYRLLAGRGPSLIPWTSLDASTKVIEISPEYNVINNDGRIRYLTVSATHDGGKTITYEVEYEITDLKGF